MPTRRLRGHQPICDPCNCQLALGDVTGVSRLARCFRREYIRWSIVLVVVKSKYPVLGLSIYQHCHLLYPLLQFVVKSNHSISILSIFQHCCLVETANHDTSASPFLRLPPFRHRSRRSQWAVFCRWHTRRLHLKCHLQRLGRHFPFRLLPGRPGGHQVLHQTRLRFRRQLSLDVAVLGVFSGWTVPRSRGFQMLS